MRYYMDILTGYIAKMVVNDDQSVIFDGVYYASDEEALNAECGRIWMQSGYSVDKDYEES